MQINEFFNQANITRWSKRGDDVSKKRADRYGIRKHGTFSVQPKKEEK